MFGLRSVSCHLLVLLTVAAASVGSAEAQDLAMPASVALPSEEPPPREAPAEKAERAQKAAYSGDG